MAEHPKLKGVNIGTWWMLLGPANMPAPVVAKLKKALSESLQTPELRKKLEDASSTIAPLNVDLEKFLSSKIPKYKKIVEFAKISE